MRILHRRCAGAQPQVGAPAGRGQRRPMQASGRNRTLYVFDDDWRVIAGLAEQLGWTYSRTHGVLLRFLLAGNTLRDDTGTTDIRAFEERALTQAPTP